MCSRGQAAPTNNTVADVSNSNSTPSLSQSKWSAEGQLLAGSVSGPASPWFGLGGAYQFFSSLGFGLRGYLPVSQPVDKSSYAIQAFARERLTHNASTELFIEPDYSENFYTFIPYASYGLAVGFLTQLQQNLSIGLLGGIELSQVVIDSIGVEDEANLVVYPKIGFLAKFDF